MNKQSFSALLLLLGTLNLTGCSTTADVKTQAAADYNAKLGAQYIRKGKFDLADEKLQKALEQNPSSADANHYYALLQEQLKQNHKADQYYRNALKSRPKDPQINNNYGTFLCKQREYGKAETHFLRALSDPLYNTPEFALTNAGVCAHEAGYFQQADKYLRKALEKRQNFPSALYAMSKLSYDRRDYSRAQAFLFRYNGIAGQNAKTLALCQEIHLQLGEVAKADQCSNRLLQDFPNSQEALSLR